MAGVRSAPDRKAFFVVLSAEKRHDQHRLGIYYPDEGRDFYIIGAMLDFLRNLSYRKCCMHNNLRRDMS